MTNNSSGLNSQALIASLFAEITAVSIELKKHEAQLHREDHLPPGGLWVLASLAQASRTVPDLARLRGTSRQNVQVIVNRLRVQAWVNMFQNPAHKRCPLIEITQKGRGVLESALKRKQAEGALWGGFPDSSAQLVLDKMRELRQALKSCAPGKKIVNPQGEPRRLAEVPLVERPDKPQGESPDEGLPVSLL